MPRRILLLVTDLEIGGTPTIVRELAIRLNEPTNTVIEVACLKDWGPVADQIRDAGISVEAFGAQNAMSIPAVVARLRKLLVERQIDTVFSFLIHANAVAAVALTRLPEVRFFQSIQTTQENPKWHWWVQGCIESWAERLIVPSNAIVEVAKTRSSVPADRFVIIPNAIEPNAFSRTLVFAHAVVRVGFLGRIDPVKRLGVAIEAVSQIREFPAELHVFGRGHDVPRSPRTVIHGSVARPQDALSQIDVLVLPSIGEGFGLVLVEAMAAGVPLVASAAGAIPEVVRDGENGLLVPVGSDDARGFADAIRRLRGDPSLRARLIENGRRTVRERFTWGVVLPQYRTLLDL